jgi:hypothetical protein
VWFPVTPAIAQTETVPSVILKDQQGVDEFDYVNLPTNSNWENLEYDSSIYDSPYKISLFNPQNGEDAQRLWSQSKSVFAYTFAIGSVSILTRGSLGTDDDDDDDDKKLLEKWVDNVKEGPVWDRDHWFYNYVGHPYIGGMYYQMARKSGYRQWDSAFYSFMMSTFWWEYGVEAFTETPSVQDLVVTPTLGWIVGEWMFSQEQRIRQRGGIVWGSRGWGNTALFFLDPIDSIGSWINNKLGRQFLTAGTGYVSYQDVPLGNSIGASTGKQISLNVRYTIGQGNEPVDSKRYQVITNDPVDTGIIGISLGVGHFRLEDQPIRLITPGWGYGFYDSYDAGAYPELTLGVYFTPRFSGRLRYGRVRVKSEPLEGSHGTAKGSFNYENYGLDLQYYFRPTARTRPFITFGIGEEIFDEDNDVKNFLWNIGLGVHHKISNRWAVYGNWIRHDSPGGITEQSVAIHLLYRFGRGEDGAL